MIYTNSLRFPVFEITKIHIAKMTTARTSGQTVVARINPLNSPTALTFSVFYVTQRNVMRFI